MSDIASPQKTKKRGKTHPEKYKRNIIKRARVTGTEYVGYDGKVKQAKKVGPPCRYVKDLQFFIINFIYRMALQNNYYIATNLLLYLTINSIEIKF